MTVTVRETRRREAGAIVAPVLCGESMQTDEGESVQTDESVQTAKRELRAAILRERSGISAASRRTVALGLRDAFLELPQLVYARCVSVYVSRPTEPATSLLREALASRGVDVVHPVIGKVTGLRWLAEREVPHPRNALVHRNRRLPRHHANDAGVLLALVPVVLIPALAVDTNGRWLGEGHGYYDHILRLLDPATLILAAVHDNELFDSAVEPVPEEPHDVRVDAALTPSRIHYLTDRCSLKETRKLSWPGTAALAEFGGRRRRGGLPGP